MTSQSKREGSLLRISPSRYFVIAILLVVIVRGAFAIGLIGSDDTYYLIAANAMASGHPLPDSPDAAYSRFAWIAWLAIWLKMGVPESALWIVQVGVEVMLAVALFRFATRFSTEQDAMFAVIAWTFVPVGLLYGGMILPDQLGLALSLFGITSVIDATRAQRIPGLIVGGALMGLAVSFKEPYFLAVPLVLGWMILRAGPAWRRLATLGPAVLVGAASLATFALEYPAFGVWTGDLMFRHRIMAANYGVQGSQQFGAGADLTGLTFYLKDVLLNPELSGMVGPLAIAAAVGLKSGIRDRGLLLGWVLVFFLFLQYGSSDLRHYNRVPQQARYVEPILVGLCVPLGVLLRRIGEGDFLRRSGLAVLLAVIAIQGLINARARMTFPVYFEDVPRSVLHAVAARETGSDTIVVSDWAGRHLSPGIRSEVQLIDSVAVCRILESELPSNSRLVVVMPERRRGSQGCAIGRGWQVDTIRAPFTPGDRALAGLPWGILSSRASLRVMGTEARPVEGTEPE